MQYLHSSTKTRSAFALIAVLVSAFFISLAYGHPMTDDKSRDQLWKEVTQARNDGLPKTEMKLLQRIYDLAVAEKADADAARALFQKIVTESRINQPAAPFAIKKLQSELENIPASMQPVADAVLANWTLAYFQNNRWRFQQRSQTSTDIGDDIETWDLRRILQSVDQSFQKALAQGDQLKAIPIQQYLSITDGGNAQGDLRRPTVFDFIVHQAIDFYAMDEQITRGIDAFGIAADSPVFADDEQFLAWQPATDDDDSFHLKTIRLYQQLMKFHKQDDDRTAYLAVDLERIEFANRNADGSTKRSAYENALQRFSDNHKQHPLSAEALSSLASSHFNQKDFVQAHRIATVGLNRFKDSVGGYQCHNLIQTIEQPAADVATELVWNAAQPDFTITYKNIDKIKFRIVNFSADQWEKGFRLQRNSTREKQQKELLNLPVVKQWETKLPSTDDYQNATFALQAPEDIPKGAYLLIGMVDNPLAGNSQKNQVMFAQQIWRTELAHIDRLDYGNNVLVGQVVNAVTGLPVAGADVKVQSSINNNRNRKLQTVTNATTDKDGLYRVDLQNNSRRQQITITKDDDVFYFGDNQYRQNYRTPDRAIQRASLFTDRSIYRPGQTIHFKVICTSSNQQDSDYTVAAGKSISVQLFDINNEVIETVDLITNDLGSAAGSFTAPADRATGQMRLQTTRTRFNGQAIVNVEQYKRPKFKVDIDKPEKSFALNDTVTVTGHAMAYNGAAIDSAKVTYRVVRGVQYADWWRWRCWWAPISLPQQEIAQGTTETKTDGSFEIKFDAVPDPAADREGQPTFTYTVTADVTDSSGETRSSSTRVNVGFVSLAADLSHEDWLTSQAPVELKLRTETLDGVGQSATGKLIVRTLVAPAEVQSKPLNSHRHFNRGFNDSNPTPDRSDYSRWEAGEIVHQQPLKTDESGVAMTTVELAAGAYRASFETTDPAGEKVSALSNLLVIDPAATNFAVKVPDHFATQKNTWQPGETFRAVWGTGYDTGSAYVEVFHRGKPVTAYWTPGDATQKMIEIPIEQQHRGGLQLVVTFVRNNRLYSHQHHIDVPWDNKQLQVKWEHFVSKLKPGGRETWTAVVSGPDAEVSAIEMVAAMYDSSLDQFAAHQWASTLGSFYRDSHRIRYQFSNRAVILDRAGEFNRQSMRRRDVLFRRLADEIAMNFGGGFGRAYGGMRPRSMRRERAMELRADSFEFESAGAPVAAMAMSKSSSAGESDAEGVSRDSGISDEGKSGEDASAGPDLSQVSIRKNLQETAFFYPNLIADADGKIKIEFEVPEALTTWKFLGLAHDSELRTGLLTDEMTTSKDLMVQPNPPRFLREGDQIYFSVKVTNQSDVAQTGVVQLRLNNALDETSVDESFGNGDFEKTFTVGAKESRSYHWKLQVPDFVGAITYKVVGASETVSDGEEGFLPVLSKRILVTESLPLPIRGNQSRTFTFDELEKMDRSDSLKNQSLTVQMTSNPSWYAVMALPYLMEYPHQCSEQTFNRLYANALGQKIVNSNPRIEKIFQQWRGTDALKSPLLKNDELRNVMIAESPWLIDGKNESQARRNVGLLFESGRIDQQIKTAVARLAEMQLADGSWPWFSGGPTNEYLTLYITTGFGRLRKLGVEVDVNSALLALSHLDQAITSRYQRLKRDGRLDQNNLSTTTALYLYGRSFFLKDQPISDQNRNAFDYFVDQAKEHWVKLGSRQSQAHIAIAMKRMGDPTTAEAIMKSLTERSLRDDELGQYWTESQNFWFWYRAPIETQALLIEAYDEVLDDAQSVEECKIWLLKQKQTQAWKTTKSTADAVYALLLRGTDRLASSKLVDVSVGGTKIVPAQVEAGTGFFQEKFTGGDITSKQKTIEVTKSDDGIAWGSVHWQYLEDVSKIEPFEGTPLTVKKSLWIKKNTDNGPELSPVTAAVDIGDELVTRVEIRADRDMEFVHLKDYRASGTEPVNVLSQYRRRDGLWYYESTRDTASHFFIDYLRKGTYVFETSVRVQHAGVYETGIAELQCMYAPEFNSHSGSVEIEVNPAP